MATSIRLPSHLEHLLTRLARQRKQTKSEVIRSALTALVETESGKERTRTPYETMKHLIGCASGGPPDLSTKSGEKFGARLRSKSIPHERHSD